MSVSESVAPEKKCGLEARAPEDRTVPAPVKRHLGLDDQRSWIVVAEGNEFIWPGYDLRKVPRTDCYAYGFLPPRFFNQVLEALLALHPTGRNLARRD